MLSQAHFAAMPCTVGQACLSRTSFPVSARSLSGETNAHSGSSPAPRDVREMLHSCNDLCILCVDAHVICHSELSGNACLRIGAPSEAAAGEAAESLIKDGIEGHRRLEPSNKRSV